MQSVPNTKICTSCKEPKLLADFHRHPQTKDGRQSRCKDCARMATRKWAASNPQKVKAHELSRMDRYRSDEEYRARWQERNRQYYAANRAQKLEQNRRWYEENKDRLKPVRAAWRKANPERTKTYHYAWLARKKDNGGAFTVEEWMALLQRFEFKCACCGSEKALTVDHIVPLSQDGPDSIENIQPLCQSCNSTKGTRHIDYR